MLFILLVVFFYIYVEGLGYLIHRAVHSRLSRTAHRAHQNHHYLYSHKDFLDRKYRASGKDNLVLYYLPFGIVSAFAGFMLLPLFYFFMLCLFMLAIGFGEDYIHSQFHIKNSWLCRYRWFMVRRYLHWVHHKRQNKNYGIFLFLYDRLFGTYARK